ncbi:MAG: hypothetical protein ABW128_15470 [Rhizorhabdus sp.]
MEKRPVIIGEGRPTCYSPILTMDGAMRYAKRHMPEKLRDAGFTASIFASNAEDHGGLWFRVCYGKFCPK